MPKEKATKATTKEKKTKKTAKGKGSKSVSIKERIKAGAKVYVGDRGGMYIIYDGKKHRVPC